MSKKQILIIGLCGRSGSGKGYIGAIFNRSGIPTIDTDAVYRDIVSDKDSPCLRELSESFGKSVIAEDGSLDRKVLAGIVFSDPGKLKLLNKITHKYILCETKKLISAFAEEGTRAVIIDAPVLFESGFDKLCDFCLCVTCGTEVCVRRICERDGIGKESAVKRLSSQISEDELRSLCDYEIVNDDIADPAAQVRSFINNHINAGIEHET